jgi:ribonuclease P protein component
MVYRRGRRVRSPSFTLFALANAVGRCRLGITVTRRIGGAVLRNRVKRRLREVFRLNRAALCPPLDLVINAHAGIENRSVRELESEFRRGVAELARRLGR